MAQVVIQLESALELQDQEQVRELNEITHVSDDKRDDHSINTRKPTMPSTDLQRPPLEEKSKFEVPRKGDARKAKTRRLGPWGAIWKRIKLFRRSELPEIHEEISEANIRVPKFDWHTIAAATGHFSPSNVVGRHIFGYVYKAILLTGQVVAVKSFSPNMGQGLEGFKNQILLHPRLQHRNINKILGYCIHGQEKLIVYEFMENREKGRHLQWSIRFKIILGIARGLVYLHQDSAPRVIHRNISPNLILLDAEMNPCISNFAFARSLGEGGHQSDLETSQIVGTLGYICPEYFRDGKVSVKADVYSFGITVLEIVSGRRILQPINQATELVTQAWKLWRGGKALDLVDESLGGVFPVEEALRSIRVALLCIQELLHHRPTMPFVLKMLEGAEVLVEPHEPRPLSFDTNATYESDVTLER